MPGGIAERMAAMGLEGAGSDAAPSPVKPRRALTGLEEAQAAGGKIEAGDDYVAPKAEITRGLHGGARAGPGVERDPLASVALGLTACVPARENLSRASNG